MDLELRKLSKVTLIRKTHETVKQEKLQTMLLLDYLREIERRGVYLEQGFSSLHNYLVVEFNYSDNEAATRVQAMRLLNVHPEVRKKMIEGTISLSQAADVNRFLKAETLAPSSRDIPTSSRNSIKLNDSLFLNKNENEGSAALAEMEKRTIFLEKIIGAVEGKSLRESKELLDKMRSVPKTKMYTIEIDEEAWRFFQELKKIDAPSARDGEYAKNVFKERYMKNINKENKNKAVEDKSVGTKSVGTKSVGTEAVGTKAVGTKAVGTEAVGTEAVGTKTVEDKLVGTKAVEDKLVETKAVGTTEVERKNENVKTSVRSRYVGKKIKLQLFQEANYQCEYKSSDTGRRCECKTGLQIDHLYPYAWGGEHKVLNMRVLCVQHNLFYGKQLFGSEKMKSWRCR